LRAPRPVSTVPLAAAAVLALLLLPIPGLNHLLWALVPNFVRNPTGNWATSRLCMPLAAATVFSAAACAGTFLTGRRRHLFAILVASGAIWSLSQACRFIAGSWHSAPAPDSAVDMLRPENVMLTRYSYSMFPHFPALPAAFTHGVTDPELEERLLGKSTFSPIGANKDTALASARVVATSDFRWDTNPAHSASAALEEAPRIEPGRSYLMKFDFAQPDAIHGVLQIYGSHFFREYGLPEHGGPKSFGAGGEHSNVFPVWTTAGPQALTVTFFPAAGGPAGQPEPPVGEVTLLSYESNSLPVRVESWLPYRAHVQAPAEAWLETPRAFQTGYHARVDGKPADVRETPDALVAVAVPAGASTVELAYVAPLGLRVLFWVSLLSSLAAVVLGSARWILHLLAVRSPAKASGALASAQEP
jgi:hypothetical protein